MNRRWTMMLCGAMVACVSADAGAHPLRPGLLRLDAAAAMNPDGANPVDAYPISVTFKLPAEVRGLRES